MNTINPLVSIIIPVYQAEATLPGLLQSVCSQSYRYLELIFINDCSTDHSVQILREFGSKLSDAEETSLMIISHDQNLGVAAARNTGLDHASGEYIYFIDADDALEPDTIELLIHSALSNDADLVGCNWYLTFNQNERKMQQPTFSTPREAIKKMLNGSMRWNLWLFMAKRSLYKKHQIRFIPGMNMGEDLLVTMQLFIHAANVSYVDKALYHYGQSNKQSLTKLHTEAHIQQLSANVDAMERCLRNSNFAKNLDDDLDFLKLNIKLPLLISDQKEQHQRWLSWYPEANAQVMKNTALPLRTRLIQWLAFKEQFWAIKLYYRMVIKMVYGQFYK
jgi:glycosyltransferase involved in cell wall biosynthesis